MNGMRGMGPMLAIMLISSAMAGCTDLLGSNSPPTATISITPSGTVKAEESVTFSAAGSSDPDGDTLTFSWSFGDGNTGTGLTASHKYSQPGEYDVQLSVNDGTHDVTANKVVKVSDANAKEPEAVVKDDRQENCDGEEAKTTGSTPMVIVWVCEDDKDSGDREIEVSTSVTLDGSESWAGCAPDDSNCIPGDEYIVEWNWDLDTDEDSDGDGDTSNDIDATGETFTWEDRSVGAWDIRLTVVDNNGFESHQDAEVYVNYLGVWSDFVIDRAVNPNSPVIMTWEYPTTNTTRMVYFGLTYPQQDSDQPLGGVSGQTTNNVLDLYIYNTTEEEVFNTSSMEDEDRDQGDCDTNEDYCIVTRVSSYMIRPREPGDWTVDLQNGETHNTDVKELFVLLLYDSKSSAPDI